MARLTRTLIAAALIATWLLAPGGTIAQDVTPTIPGTEECTVEPRTEAEILAIVDAATSATGDNFDERHRARNAQWNGVTIVGSADFATQQAIRGTLFELIACVNAEMPLSQYALYTEDAIINNAPTVEELRGELREGEVVESRGPGRILDILYVQTLSNGQVAAVVVYSGEMELPFDAFATYFEEVDGHWLFDVP